MRSILKMLMVFPAVIALISCQVRTAEDGSLTAKTSVNANVSDAPVKLDYAYASNSTTSGGAGSYVAYQSKWVERIFEVRVKNLGYAKKVTVYGVDRNGQWVDQLSLSYDRPAENGYEIWSGSVNDVYYYSESSWNGGSKEIYYDEIKFAHSSKEFVIRYAVNGQTYWDNNGGKNYIFDLAMKDKAVIFGKDVTVHLIGLLNAQYMKTGLNEAALRFNASPVSSVMVKNLGYVKKVTLVGTVDQWKTKFEKSFTHMTGPDANHQEYWDFVSWDQNYNIYSFVYDENTTHFEYCIRYEVNGQTYWDNNGGKNYQLDMPNL